MLEKRAPKNVSNGMDDNTLQYDVFVYSKFQFHGSVYCRLYYVIICSIYCRQSSYEISFSRI